MKPRAGNGWAVCGMCQRSMPLVYLPDVESLFLWGPEPVPRELSSIGDAGEPGSVVLLVPEGLRDTAGRKIPLLDAIAKLARSMPPAGAGASTPTKPRAKSRSARRAELKTTCSCPNWGDPCKHVAATHYVLGEALDRDPFLLFELRGRTKDQVLNALRAVRGSDGLSETTAKRAGGSKAAASTEALEVPTVKLGKLKADDYDKPSEPLPALHFSFEEPVTHGAILRQVGAPTAWESDTSPADVLAPLVRPAAETARRIAMTEPGETDEFAIESNHPRAKPARTRKGKGP